MISTFIFQIIMDVPDSSNSIIKMEGEQKINPWSVQSIDEFLYYNCPECDFKVKDGDSFEEHALLSHEQAKTYLLSVSESNIQDPMNFCETVTSSIQPPPTKPSEPLGIKEEPMEFEDLDEDEEEDTKVEDFYDEDDDQPGISQCYVCGETCVSKSSVRKHIKSHHYEKVKQSMYGPPRQHQCPECKLMFATLNSLGLHVCGEVLPSWTGQGDSKKCNQCNITFKYTAFLEHMAVKHSREKKFQCELCDYKAALPVSLKKHIARMHAVTDPVKCDICHKLLKNQETLKIHVSLMHVKQKSVQCDQCDYKAKSNGLLKRHVRIVHEKIKPHVCHICGKGFNTTTLMKNHMDNIHNSDNKSYICERCGKSFSSLTTFKIHVNSHQLFQMCTICDRIFTAKSKLRNHLGIDHQVNCTIDDMFVCPHCNKKHVSSNDLNEHLHTEHGFVKEHLCSQCDKPFASKPMLTLHLLEQHEFNPIEKVSYKSELADALSNDTSTAQALSLSSMQVMEDTNLKGVRCDICGRVLGSNRILSAHKKQVHDKSNHIKCDQCDFSTFQPCMLKKHMKSHDKSKTYKCPQCNFTTHVKERLPPHIRSVHEKIRPHKCTECDNSFQAKSRLAVHMLREHNIVYKYK